MRSEVRSAFPMALIVAGMISVYAVGEGGGEALPCWGEYNTGDTACDLQKPELPSCPIISTDDAAIWAIKRASSGGTGPLNPPTPAVCRYYHLTKVSIDCVQPTISSSATSYSRFVEGNCANEQ